MCEREWEDGYPKFADDALLVADSGEVLLEFMREFSYAHKRKIKVNTIVRFTQL